MNITAKWRVVSINDQISPDGTVSSAVVKLTPVTGESSENKTWSKYTPSGLVELNITNPSAVAAFREAHEFLVTFAPIDGK